MARKPARVHLLALTLLLLNIVAAAQTPPPKGEAKSCVVAGRVTNGRGGEPVRKAKIMLLPRDAGEEMTPSRSEQLTAITDQSGSFVIENIQPGRYVLMFEKPGFSGRGANRESRRELTLAPGQDIRDIVLTMIPAAAITGRVLDQDGEPMPHASVLAMRYTYSGRGGRRLLPRASDQTNDRGEYRIYDLAPGQYYVAVQPSSTAEEPANETTPDKRRAKLRYPMTYYPGTLDESGAADLTLHGGDEARADFALTPMRTVNVSGRVVGGPANAPVVVQIEPRNGAYSGAEPATLKPGETNFELKSVLPGSYTIVATTMPTEVMSGTVGFSMPNAEALMANMRSAKKKITVSGTDITGVTLSLVSQGEHEIRGRLIVEGRAPEKLAGLGIRLMPANWRDADDEADMFSMFGGGGELHNDGTFTIKSAGNGKVVPLVYAAAPGFEDYYTKTALLAGRDVMGGFTLAQAQGATLDVVISSDGAYVEGLVLRDDKSPQTDATVVLVPDDLELRSHMDLFATARSDQRGHFDMRGVRPGSYKLYAFEALGDDEGAYYYEDFLRQFDDFAQSLKLEAKQHASVALRPIRTKELSD